MYDWPKDILHELLNWRFLYGLIMLYEKITIWIQKKKCQVLHDQEIIEPDVEVDENLPINDQILMNKLIEASEIDPTDITIPTTKANKAVSCHT